MCVYGFLNRLILWIPKGRKRVHEKTKGVAGRVRCMRSHTPLVKRIVLIVLITLITLAGISGISQLRSVSVSEFSARPSFSLICRPHLPPSSAAPICQLDVPPWLFTRAMSGRRCGGCDAPAQRHPKKEGEGEGRILDSVITHTHTSIHPYHTATITTPITTFPLR